MITSMSHLSNILTTSNPIPRDPPVTTATQPLLRGNSGKF